MLITGSRPVHSAHNLPSTDLAVTVVVDYTPPVDFDRTADVDYRAGSGPVTLTCQVEGATGTVNYQWSSNCSGDCFVQTQTTQSVSQDMFVRAGVDGGTHTCTASDSSGSGSGSTVMNIIGMLVFMQ